MKVKKLNGKLEEFNKEKIETAILKAAEAASCEISNKAVTNIANDVESWVEKQKDVKFVKITDISEQVENKLLEKYTDIAKHYIAHHRNKEVERLENSELIKLFRKKLSGENIENQNANLDERTFSGRLNEAARVLVKDDALTNKVSKTTRDNHLNNRVYIHDLDNYSMGTHNCLSIPFDKLLENGFVTRNTDIRKPKSIDAAIQLIIAIMQVQSIEQFGGVAATHFDWTMVPYIRHSFWKLYRDGLHFLKNETLKKPSDEKIENTSIEDTEYYSDKKARDYAMELVDRELHQALESFYHEANLLAVRSGGQLPFSSINYGTCTLKEGQLCIEAILDGSLSGIGKFHKIPIFPCGIWQYMKGVNDKPGTPNYYLFQKALKSTALRFYPNYANCNWSVDENTRNKDRKFKEELLASLSKENYAKLVDALKKNQKIAEKLSMYIEKGEIKLNYNPLPTEIFSTMGCRTVNLYDINAEDSIKKNIDALIKNKPLYDDVFSAAIKDGRGNICPTTIILPTLAMEADRDVEKFMALLEKTIYEAKDSLIDRFKYIASQKPTSASFMYGNGSMGGYVPEEGIGSALKHGTIVIGQLGMAEALQLLVGCDQSEPVGMELAKRIEQLYKDLCAKFKEEGYYIIDNKKPDIEEIKKNMIDSYKKELNRELTNEELLEISNYCKNREKDIK